MTGLACHGATIDLSGTRIVSEASLDIAPGEFVGLVGPNGSGKTTLLRALDRALPLSEGTVRVGADDIWEMSPRAAAQAIAVVAQEHPSGFEFTAAEVAAMGRIPHRRGVGTSTAEERRLVIESLDAMGLATLAHRPFTAMSGGERQRALIARALVQQAPILLLDEPTNHLDVRFQLDVLRRVRMLRLTTVAALHDINLAAAWCDRVVVMSGGRIVAAGPPKEALTAEIISAVFGVDATEFVHPVSGEHQLHFRLPGEDKP